MTVKRTRSIKFGEYGSIGNLKVGDLNEFTAGLKPEAEVTVRVSVVPADRGGSDQKTVTLSIEE